MAKKIAHRIYEMSYKGRTFQVDGQNHESDSKEWQLFEQVAGCYGDELEWIETYPTKAMAIDDILNNFE